MTDHTTDAKLHEVIYDAVADAITVHSTADFEIAENLPERLIAVIGNTRPQPARPKVEDDPAMVELEVATAIQTLLDSNMKPIAALLERLADDLQNWWSAAIVAMKAQEAAEAKLAERGAELAKADAVIERRECQWLALADGHSPMFPNEHEIDQYETEAIARHAARQQQKA